MATPRLHQTAIAGRLGEILIDVRTAQRRAAPTVLVVHGFKGFKDWGMFPPFAERLARAGFTAISFNLSGSGYDAAGEVRFPDRFGNNTFTAELADLEAVISALHRGDLGVDRPSSLGLVGHSRGGGIAALMTAREPLIAALVTWAAIATVERWTPDQRRAWRACGRHDVVNSRTGQVLPLTTALLDDLEHNATGTLSVESAARRIRAPWLIVHGTADETVPIDEGRRLAGWAQDARFDEIAGAGHTFGAVHPFRGMTAALEQLFDISVAHLGRHLT
ncbi:MAG: alpha/beta hydrolase [Gemmatimonadetes bacterium]|nr:alpha/beta hydrolase [Gemmatimonadota bacterium]